MNAPALANMSPEQKRALLADLLKKKAATAANGASRNGDSSFLNIPPITPADRDQPLPLSPGQETLWFLDQLEPGNTTYNCPAVVRISGPLDSEIVRRAFEVIV